MLLWRIVDRALAKTAFSGQGASDYGGRWNSPGVRMVYCSEHPALAAFEKLVISKISMSCAKPTF